MSQQEQQEQTTTQFTTQKQSLRATCTGCARSMETDSVADRCPICGGLLFAESAPLEKGFVIEGKYEIQHQLGVGAWGTVYKATQVGLGREVAVKLLHRHLVMSPGKLERFRLEAHSLKQLSHEGVAAIYDVGVLELPDGEQPYFVQEFVSGTSMRNIMRGKELDGSKLKLLFCQMLDILDQAHAKGIVHRDIKPSNIVVSDFETRPSLKLLDFGIAKLTTEENAPALTATGDLLGTPLYMSPEQCVAEPVDNRSDLYAVGCMLHEAVSGSSPFWAESSMQCMMKHVNDPPPDLREKGIDDSYVRVIEKSLQKDPANRFQSASEFRAALQELSDIYETGTRPRPKFNKWLTVIAGMVLVLGLASTVSVYYFMNFTLPQMREHGLLPNAAVDLSTEEEPVGQQVWPKQLLHAAGAPATKPKLDLPEDVASMVTEIVSDGTADGYYVITDRLSHWNQATKKLDRLGTFPMGGAGLLYSAEKRAFFVLGRTNSTPGWLTAVYRIDPDGRISQIIRLSKPIPTSDSADVPVTLRMGRAGEGRFLQATVPQGGDQVLDAQIDLANGNVSAP